MAVKKAVAKKKVAAKKKAVVQPLISWTQDRLDEFIESCPGKYDIDDYETFTTEVRDFPGCCAFNVVHGLRDLRLPSGPSKAVWHAYACLDLLRHVNAPIIMVTTIGCQVREAAILKAVGFTAIHSVRNPNTGNEVTIWLGHTAR